MLSKMFKNFIICLLIITLFTTSTVTAFSLNNDAENDKINKEQVESEITTDIDLNKQEAQSTEKLQAIVKNVSNDPTVGVIELKNSILQKETSTEGLSTKHEIKNINVFKSALQLKYPEMDDVELGKSILLSLGDSEEFINALPEEKIIEATQYVSLVQTESFFKQSADGTKIKINEQEYSTAVVQAETSVNTSDDNGGARSSSTNIGKHEEIKTFGNYLKLTTTASKHNPDYALNERNYFSIRAEAEWINTPFYKKKDILAISSSGNVDNHYITCAGAFWQNYSDTAHLGINEGYGNIYSENSLHIYAPSYLGIAVDVNLNVDDIPHPLTSVFAYYGIVTQTDVSCNVGYAHSTIGLSDPTISIDSTGALSFSIGLTGTMDEYFASPFELTHEIYSIQQLVPSEYETISYTSTAPRFVWNSKMDTPQEYILEIDYLNNGTYFTKTVSTESYLLTSDEWQQIKNNSPFIGTTKIIYWRIKINHTIYPNETYYSPWVEFIITGAPLTSQETMTIPSDDLYIEKRINLGSDGYKDLNITFEQGKTKFIQTFGTKDTVLELYSSSGTLLTSNDNGGYGSNGFIAYYFTANMQYKLRVKYKDASISGYTKLAITPACGAPKQGLSSVTTYDDIRAFEGTGTNWHTYAQPYYTRVITFTPTETGDYTFEIESDFDTYIYVIDPRSHANLIYTVNCKDNGGEGLNPLMTTYLDANIPYFIIYSAKDPTTLTEQLDLTLYISKQ